MNDNLRGWLAGFQGGDSILIHAVKGGQVEVVRALLDKYVDVDTQGSVSDELCLCA